jgi:hypothetical protein
MKQSYFVHNGRQYNTGDIILFRFFDGRIGKSYETQVKFLYYDTETKEYFIEVYGKEYGYTENLFYRNMYGVVNPRAPAVNISEHTFSDELNLDGMLVAWIWYVFIMAVGIIFYDRIGIWILTSIIFFNYRNKKLKEAGYK